MKSIIKKIADTVKAAINKLVSSADRRVTNAVTRTYKNAKTRAVTILLLDLGLFIGFAAVISIPAVAILSAPLGKTLLICAAAWIGMDVIACAAKKLVAYVLEVTTK